MALGTVWTLGILGVAFTISLSHPRGSVTGEIQSRGAPHGTFVVRPVTCFSGGHWGFTGVWVVTETLTLGERRGFRGGLKILKNDGGDWEAYVENPTACEGFQCEQRRVDRRQCALFDLAVDDGRWWRDDGHARLDCVFSQGGTLKADIMFTGCGRVPSSGGDASL